MLRALISAAARLDSLSKIAMICLFLGWFLTDTLTATWGSLQHGVRFFEMAAVINDPSMMFFRIGASAGGVLFALLCLVCIAAPLLQRLTGKPSLALANLAPLLLLLVCAVLLYHRTSAEFVPSPHDPEGLAGRVAGLANKLLNRSSAVVAHHVSVGLGGYLGLLSCVALAVQGVRQMRLVSGNRARALGD